MVTLLHYYTITIIILYNIIINNDQKENKPGPHTKPTGW